VNPGEPYPRRDKHRLEDDDSKDTEVKPVDLAEVVSMAVRGEPAGWNALFDRFYDDVYRYALSRLGRREVAEDITQDVFVTAVRAIRSLRDSREPAVQAWFLRICRNKVIDYQRQTGKLATLTQRLERDTPAAAGGEAGDERAAHVFDALQKLTEAQRDVLIRRFILDQSLETVAEAMRRNVGSVKSLQHRALEALHREMERKQ
jgi:RNA polymerase sigma-70 factor, ECF subfamily